MRSLALGTALSLVFLSAGCIVHPREKRVVTVVMPVTARSHVPPGQVRKQEVHARNEAKKRDKQDKHERDEYRKRDR